MTNPTDTVAASPLTSQSKSRFQPEMLIVWVLFLLSGACGLIYEVLWCRHLGLIFGNTSHSISAVLTAFMSGLALGSFIAGRNCHRIQRPLYVYGLLEVLIGVYCALLPLAFNNSLLIGFYKSLYGESGGNALPVARFVISFVLLLIPTTFMGATLPILSHFLARSRTGLGRTVGALYAVNSLGAVVGAFAAGFFLLPLLGKSGSNWLAVGFNLLLGALAIGFGMRRTVPPMEMDSPQTTATDQSTTAAVAQTVTPAALKLTLLTFGITGFAAMATQIGWTRAISLGTGSSTYAFSLIVAVFILGLSSGGWWGSRIAPRTPDPVAFLARLLLMVGLFCLIVATILGYAPILFFFLISWGTTVGWKFTLALQAAGIALLIIVPTFFMGATMPLTVQIASRTAENAGKTVGNVYTINTIGSILGSFLGGLVLIPALQIQSTLELMALLYVLPGILLFLNSKSLNDKKQLLNGLAVLVPIIVIGIVSRPWDPIIMSSGMYLLRDTAFVKAAREFRILNALPNEGDVAVHYYKEGTEATVAIREVAGNISLRVGGKPDASSTGDMATQIGLTLVPEVLHKGPEEILVIGLGSGVSVGAALAPESVKRVDVVEMSPEVVAASWWFQPFNKLSYNQPPPTGDKRPNGTPWLQTPKVEVIINDGRNHLLLSNRMYDVIASEPSNPWIAGIGNLFTKEAFDLCRSHLKPGGIMCQWLHNYSLENRHFFSVAHTFSESFKYVQLWHINRSDYLLIGSDAELTIPIDHLRSRLSQPGIKKWAEQVHFDRETSLVACVLSSDAMLRQVSSGAPLHTDDNMLLEFEAPRALYSVIEYFNPSRLLPFPERSLKLPNDKDDSIKLLRQLDACVSAREFHRYAIEIKEPVESLGLTAYKLDSYNEWAIDERNKVDFEKATELVSGERKREKPNPDAALRLTAEAKNRSKFVNTPFPQLSTVVRRSILLLIEQGKLDEAMAEIEKIQLPANEAGEIPLLKARVFMQKRDFKAAYAQAAEALKLGYNPVACTEVAALIQEQSGHIDDAVSTLRQVLSKPHIGSDKASVPMWTQYARLQFERNQFKGAYDAANIAAAIAPKRSPHLLMQAKALLALNLPLEAVSILRERIPYAPDDPDVRIDYARAIFKAAEDPRFKGISVDLLSRARRACHDQTMLFPEMPVGWELLCRVFLELQKCEGQDVALLKAQAQNAWNGLLEAVKGDLSKVPEDLKEKFKQ